MAQNSKANASTLPVSAPNAQALETSIRQLLANGNSKAALESAKQFHKAQHTAASESLLLEAYSGRIQSLLDQNLAAEAKSLLLLVEERFPNAKTLLNDVGKVASARSGDLAALLQPLNDPELNAERRADIEQIIQTEVTDLRALADCAALPPEHSLRRAAAALDRAFDATTSGPVNEEQIALPEVSHRSPLASWKLLIRAIACLHRGDDRQCRDYLASIKPESVPARLVPAMQAILGVNTNADSLKPTERTLVSRISADLADFRSALEQVDRAFSGDNVSHIFKALHVAIRECQRCAPDRLGMLKQIAHVRGSTAGLDPKRLLTSLDGEPRRDAAYFRMFARSLELAGAGHPRDLAEACELWDEFRRHALRERLFTAQSVEMAVLYLHMADTLAQIPGKMLKELQGFRGFSGRQPQGDEQYYLYPEKLFARACAIDPHPEAFSQWLSWANAQSVTKGESVAKEWHRLRPGDIEPLLHLMKNAEKRNAFPSALAYLEKAERVDAVHSVVRAARLRLLAAAAMRHLQQKKPHLAMERIAEMAELPQSQQADRPAFLAALRALNCTLAGDQDGAERSLREVEGLLGGLAAGLLIFGVAAGAKRLEMASLPDANALKPDRRETIPASLARVIAIAKNFGITKFSLPVSYFDEAEKQFSGAADALDLEQIRALGEMGLATEHPKLAWAASTAGLKRGVGQAEAFSLLLRARALPQQFYDRQMALAAAAAELARFHRDTEVVDKAVEILRDRFGGNLFPLTLEQAREIARKEAAFPSFPGLFDSGPDYSHLFPDTLCPCPDCRRGRGETPSSCDGEDTSDEDIFEDVFEMDEAEMRTTFNRGLPKDVPPEMADMLFKVMKEAFQSGESPEKLLSQIMGGRGGAKAKKRRRNR